MHTSQLSLDWQGVYTGILPCADCEGIRTTIRLNDDLTFTMRQQFIGKSAEIYEQTGKFRWNDDGNSITLVPETNVPTMPLVYGVGEGFLLQYNQKGERITGNLAAMHRLEKTEPSLTDIRWKLIELYGEPVPGKKSLNSAPYIEFARHENRVSGNSSCNRFFSTWETPGEGKLVFSAVGATKMACPEMEIEFLFFKVLENTTGYLLVDETLVLLSARNAPLARFVAHPDSEPVEKWH